MPFQEADIAIGSLTITADREKAIDFTKPFMDFTMSLIMEKPPQAEVDLFVFLSPFKLQLWMSVLAMVSSRSAICIFVVFDYFKASMQ